MTAAEAADRKGNKAEQGGGNLILKCMQAFPCRAP